MRSLCQVGVTAAVLCDGIVEEVLCACPHGKRVEMRYDGRSAMLFVPSI